LIVFMGLFFWSAALYFKLYRPPHEALEIFITGKQWMWRAQHPDGQREINALHLPLNRRIKLTMTSEDVLHAYFIPAFRTKADVLPGRYTTIWFETTKTGSFHLFCAEYCGSYHSGMIGKVTVLEPAAYQAWLSGGETTGGTPVQSGQKLFASLACNTCHKTDGQGRGPALEGQFGQQVTLDSGQKVQVDEPYLRESILNPRAKVVAGFEPVMPTFQGQISEENILQLIAYIKSIGAQKKQDGTQAGAPKPGATATPAAAPATAPRPQGN
jgi:cytochrome c oxidase subunit 2